mmetsp:Transcript_126521/g.366258  ORF Transcript_126521/g.366258 Transcript_126521/m.366258 type:complete len:261 (-) Transcript_126521:136-918(-)
MRADRADVEVGRHTAHNRRHQDVNHATLEEGHAPQVHISYEQLHHQGQGHVGVRHRRPGLLGDVKYRAAQQAHDEVADVAWHQHQEQQDNGEGLQLQACLQQRRSRPCGEGRRAGPNDFGATGGAAQGGCHQQREGDDDKEGCCEGYVPGEQRGHVQQLALPSRRQILQLANHRPHGCRGSGARRLVLIEEVDRRSEARLSGRGRHRRRLPKRRHLCSCNCREAVDARGRRRRPHEAPAEARRVHHHLRPEGGGVAGEPR